MKYDFSIYLDIKRQVGDQISARCPFHDDRTPSFSADSESGLWKCFAGCGHGNFFQFLSRIASDPGAGIRRSKLSGRKRYTRDEGFKTVAFYEYMSTDKEYHLKVTRQEKPSGEKRFFQEHKNEQGRWVPGGATKPLFPYLFHEWCEPSIEVIFFVEGEKCVEFLKSNGIAATTVACGSSKWNSEYSRFFKNRRVIILPDNDEPGKRFANSVHSTLCREGILACSVELPGLNIGEDVVDWLSQNRTVNDLFDVIGSQCAFSVR